MREKLWSVRRDNATRAAGAGALTPPPRSDARAVLTPRSRRRSCASSLGSGLGIGLGLGLGLG